jgi:micrococcal nuclease
LARVKLKVDQILLSSASQSLVAPAYAAEVAGPVRIIDGDTLILTNQNIRVRLGGIDAPEIRHPGYDHDDDFGPEAKLEMQSIVGDAIITCALDGQRSHERYVGVCRLPSGEDIGALIVSHGLALDCAHFSGGRYRALEPDGAREILRQAKYC